MRSAPKKTLRVLGIDPGSHRTGWGVIEVHGAKLVGIAADVIRTSAKQALEHRLLTIYEQLGEVIEAWKPDAVALESVFFAKYPQAALQLGHVRGVAMLRAIQAKCGVFAYPPASVKQAITGRGKADKTQVAQMVAAILKVELDGQLDASDALAIAITHARSFATSARLRPTRLTAR